MKIFKRIIIMLLIAIIFLGMSYYEHNYTRKDCRVLAKCDGELTIIDSCGYEWYWYADNEKEWQLYSDININDTISIRMFDNCTSGYIQDDEITKIILDK